MMRFVEWPLGLALFIILPALGFLIFNIERRSRAARLGKLGTRNMLVRLAPEGAPVGMWRIVRVTGALALCGFAFAGPRWGLGPQESHTGGADVVLALDASLSMMAPDVQPNRLENMKNVVRQLHTLSPNDRFAILAFAGHSYILTPLTSDPSAIDLYVDKLDPKTVGVAGSSIANALHQALGLVGNKKENDRAVIVMSDGESFEPIAAVKGEAKHIGDAGAALVTVGFGTVKGDSIPIIDSTGKHTFKLDRVGGVVTTHYSPDYLNAAAQEAHGTFIPADAPNKAEKIRKVLDGLKTSARATANGSDLLFQFEWFVIPALFLIAMDTILVLRPRRRQLAVVRNAALAAGALATAACQRTQAPSKSQAAAQAAADTARMEAAYLKDYNRGTKNFGSLASIKKDTIQATNTGLRAAASMLDTATQAKTPDVRQNALFNAGWSRLALAMRMLGVVPTPKEKSDTALKKAAGTVASTGNGASSSTPPMSKGMGNDGMGGGMGDDGMGGGGMGDSAAKDPAAAAQQAKAAAQQAKMDTLMAYANVARAQYRAYLAANPNDADARWNYELTLLPKQMGKGGKGKPKQQQKKKMQKPPKKFPPPKMFRLPPQEAKQLLDAASQREQSPNPTPPTPTATVPGGNDW